MKIRSLLIVCLCVLCGENAFAQNVARRQIVTAAGRYQITSLVGTGVSAHNLSWTVTGSISSCTIRLQQASSLPNWNDLSQTLSCTSSGLTPIINATVSNVSIQVVTFSGTGQLAILYQGFLADPQALEIGVGTNKTFSGAPTGNCYGAQFATNSLTGDQYNCLVIAGVGSWNLIVPGGGAVGGAGTANTLPKWTAGTTLGNSQITDTGALITLPGKTVANTINNIRFANQFSGTDWCAKVQAAHDDLPTVGGTVDATGLEGTQTCAAALSLTKPIHLKVGHSTITMSGGATELFLVGSTATIEGVGNSGAGSIFLVGSAVGATVDFMRIDGSVGVSPGPIDGLTLRNFAVSSQSGTPGRYGFHFDTTTNAIFRIVVNQVTVANLGSYGIYLTNPVNTDGFFTSSIENSVIYNGIRLNRAGDTLRIINNTITGANCGVDVDFVAGASTLLVEGNNITTLGGALCVGASAVGLEFLHNEVETPASYVGSNGAVIDIAGTVGAPADHVLIQGNNIQVLSANSNEDGIRVDYANYTQILDNYFSRGTAPAKDIAVTAHALDTMIGENRWQDTTVASILSDAGTRTTFNATLAGVSRFKQTLTLDPTKVVSWLATTATPQDVGISRLGVGQLALGNGTAGDITADVIGNTFRTNFGTEGMVGGAGVRLGNTVGLFFSSTADQAGVKDAILSRIAAGILGVGLTAAGQTTGQIQIKGYLTDTNCADGAGAAACGSAAAGSFVIDAAAGSVVVSTTAVTANSQILIQEDSSLGTRLGSITCNTTIVRTYTVTARTAATSFTVTPSAAPIANPACLSYWIVN